jgi:hypothetical protein
VIALDTSVIVRMDFADALHLASSRASLQFVTFDRDMALTARDLADCPAVDLLS